MSYLDWQSIALSISLLKGLVRKVHIIWEPLMVAQLLKYCATNRKVAGSIPDNVIGIFH
jgi:hypothetical protein